jgi:hypothetical protein
MPATEDKRLRCIVCDAPFYPNRWWQVYRGAECSVEFHRRERQQMRQWWKQSQQVREIVARVDEAVQAHEVPQAEPIRRRI